MKVQDRVQFVIGQLTLSNFNLQEKIEELEAENVELKKKLGLPEKKPHLKEVKES